jgi:transcriptional regulator with XRE-family HTH domain
VKNTPYEHTRLARYLDQRILQLKSRKSQRQIALEAGFRNPNVLSMIKAGSSKLPLDRVPAMAKALDVDPRYLLRLAFEQEGFKTAKGAIDDILGTVVSNNELDWLNEIRDASNNSDPRLTSRQRMALRAIFGA